MQSPTGPKDHYYKDDDKDRKGQLVESCFRAYDSDIDSYIDRSNFLMQTERYKTIVFIGPHRLHPVGIWIKNCGYE